MRVFDFGVSFSLFSSLSPSFPVFFLSLHARGLFQRLLCAGDSVSAETLQKNAKEEEGHVAAGIKWFCYVKVGGKGRWEGGGKERGIDYSWRSSGLARPKNEGI